MLWVHEDLRGSAIGSRLLLEADRIARELGAGNSALETFLAHPTSPAELQASINAGLLWVAEEAGGEVIGFVACQAIDSFLHIAEMDVHPNHGRRGIARLRRSLPRG